MDPALAVFALTVALACHVYVLWAFHVQGRQLRESKEARRAAFERASRLADECDRLRDANKALEAFFAAEKVKVEDLCAAQSDTLGANSVLHQQLYEAGQEAERLRDAGRKASEEAALHLAERQTLHRQLHESGKELEASRLENKKLEGRVVAQKHCLDDAAAEIGRLEAAAEIGRLEAVAQTLDKVRELVREESS